MGKATKQKHKDHEYERTLDVIEVFCRFRLVGFHNWPDAPLEFAYLRNTHRHEFHFVVVASVFHDNRQIEFCEMKREAENAMFDFFKLYGNVGGGLDFKAYSCEMLAGTLRKLMIDENEKYKAITSIEVSEDGENGAHVSFA